jgi:hypothetical protein
MPAWAAFVYGMGAGAALLMLVLYVVNWRILRCWTADLRKDR